jgi:hypothetical protein
LTLSDELVSDALEERSFEGIIWQREEGYSLSESKESLSIVGLVVYTLTRHGPLTALAMVARRLIPKPQHPITASQTLDLLISRPKNDKAMDPNSSSPHRLARTVNEEDDRDRLGIRVRGLWLLERGDRFDGRGWREEKGGRKRARTRLWMEGRWLV